MKLLATRCLVDGDADADPAPLLAAVERHCPVLEQDLGAHCPHCAADSTVRFDLQAFLLATLAREGEWLAREVHCLAVTYHWSLAEILGLPRSQRHRYVALVEADLAARRRASP